MTLAVIDAMKKYQPNFTDPRIKRALVKALDWSNEYLSVNNEHWLSTREIDRYLTCNNRPLGRWLRSKLLICVNATYDSSAGRCKTYKLNLEGYTEVCDAIGHTPKFKLSQQLQHQLDTGEFEYKDQSNRSFNPIQYIPKQTRRTVLDNYGYRWHYDIEAAAPTLLVQAALRVQQQKIINATVNGQKKPKEYTLANLISYTENRSAIRSEIAKQCHCSTSDVKLVINSLLQGAVLSKSTYCSIFRELNHNYDLITRLQHNQLLQGIRDDIRDLWMILRDELPVRYLTDVNGRQRRRALSGRDKSGYYRQLEEQVGKVIRDHLKRNNNRHLWIHDGWSCEMMLDEVQLVEEVRRQTGFVIKLDRELFDQGASY